MKQIHTLPSKRIHKRKYFSRSLTNVIKQSEKLGFWAKSDSTKSLNSANILNLELNQVPLGLEVKPNTSITIKRDRCNLIWRKKCSLLHAKKILSYSGFNSLKKDDKFSLLFETDSKLLNHKVDALNAISPSVVTKNKIVPIGEKKPNNVIQPISIAERIINYENKKEILNRTEIFQNKEKLSLVNDTIKQRGGGKRTGNELAAPVRMGPVLTKNVPYPVTDAGLREFFLAKTEQRRLKLNNTDFLQTKENIGSRWETPGDGFCVVWAALCCVPGSSFFGCMSQYLANNEVDILRANLLCPILRNFKNLRSWATVEDEDKLAISEFLSNNTRPRSLETEGILRCVEELYKIPPIVRLYRDVPASLAAFKTLLDSGFNGDFLVLIKDHAEYATVQVRTDVHKQKKLIEKDCQKGFLNLLSGEDKKQLQDVVQNQLTKDSAMKKLTSIKLKNSILKEDKNKLEKSNQDLQKEVIKEKTVTAKIEEVILKSQTSKPKANPEDAQLVSYAHPSSFSMTKGKIDGYYSHNFKLGNEFDKVLFPIDIRLFAKPIVYAHPGLRILADYSNFMMIKYGLSMDNFYIVEHAAKFQKVLKWLERLRTSKDVEANKKAASYFYTRPNIIRGIDDVFLVKNDIDASKDIPFFHMDAENVVKYLNENMHFSATEDSDSPRVSEEKHESKGTHRFLDDMNTCRDKLILLQACVKLAQKAEEDELENDSIDDEIKEEKESEGKQVQKKKTLPEHNYKFMNSLNTFQIFTDVLYYRSAWDGFSQLPINSVGAFSIGNYPKTDGIYHYFDDEGYLVIKGSKIRNFPNNNGNGYEHDLICIPTESFSVALYPNKDKSSSLLKSIFGSNYRKSPTTYLNCSCQFTCPTGKRTSYSWYSYHISEVAEFKIVTPFVDSSPTIVEQTKASGVKTSSIQNGKLVWTKTGKWSIEYKQVQVHWALYDIIDRKITFRNHSKESMLDSLNFLWKEFKGSTIRDLLITRTMFDDTAMYWMQSSSILSNEMLGGIEAPVMENMNKKLVSPSWWGWLAPKVIRCFVREGRNFSIDSYVARLHGVPIIQDSGDSAMERNRIINGYRAGYSPSYDPIKEVHHDYKDSDVFHYFGGNSYIQISKQNETYCTCKDYTYSKAINVENQVHFGNCFYNLEAAIYSRGFNTMLEPELHWVYAFRVWFKKSWWLRHKYSLYERIEKLTSEDLSLEKFIAETDPKKRILYKNAFEKFVKTNHISTKMTIMSKNDETHLPSRKIRPRLLFNPSDELKSVGAYLARIMISLMKTVEEGFISGYSMDKLQEKMMKTRESGMFTGNTSYSYDGKAHDAHQHWTIIESIDHFLIRKLCKRIIASPYSAIPESHAESIISALSKTSYEFRSDNKKSNGNSIITGKITGTVFSGHPTLTTLFNTLRTILYNRFAVWILYPDLEESQMGIWASGDDVLGWLPVHLNTSKFREILGGDFGKHGLGQCAQDLIVGSLSDQSFLSKHFIIDNEIAAMIPKCDRLYKSGTLYSTKSGISLDEHRLLQFVSNTNLPKQLAIFSHRFLHNNCITEPTVKMNTMLKYDWAYKLKAENKEFNQNLEELVPFRTESSFTFQAMEDSPAYENNMMINQTKYRAGFVVSEFPFVPNSMEKNSNKIKNKQKRQNKKQKIQQFANNVVQKINRRENPRKVVTKFTERISDVSNWVKNEKLNEARFVLGLLDPESCIVARIPSLIPISTATASMKGVFSFNTNALGNALLFCNPGHSSVIVTVRNGPTVDDIADWNTFPNTITYPPPLVPATHYMTKRVVSACITAVDLTPALSKTGIIYYGSVYSGKMSTGGLTLDFFRDHDWVSQVTNAMTTSPVQANYLPMDSSALEFGAGNAINSEVPVIFFSGLSANAKIHCTYSINIEYVPISANLDLVETKPASLGNPLNSLGILGRVRTIWNKGPPEIASGNTQNAESALKSLSTSYSVLKNNDHGKGSSGLLSALGLGGLGISGSTLMTGLTLLGSLA